jgi:transposase-like protein
VVSPSAKRRAVKLVIETGIGTTAEACRALGLARSSYYCNSTASLESRQMHDRKFEDVVKSAQDAAVLVLVY